MVGVRELVIEYADRVPDDQSDVLAVVFPGATAASVASPLRIGLALPVLGGAQAEIGLTERYQSFCAGRAAGFESNGFTLEGDLPAASAVGATGEGFVVTVVASRRDVTYVENPRQVSAFHYPRQYGPRSPSFARASRVELDEGALIVVSGTASIVGHASLHVGDALAQVDETVENLRLVYGAATGREIKCLGGVPGALYRIYVKRPSDFEAIRERFQPRIASDASCLWLHGDICRGELLVEVEMIGRE